MILENSARRELKFNDFWSFLFVESPNSTTFGVLCSSRDQIQRFLEFSVRREPKFNDFGCTLFIESPKSTIFRFVIDP